MKLRESMLINGILYNCKAWHGVTNKQEKLEAINEALLRKLLKAHSKQKLIFFLEFRALLLRWVLAQRRIICMKHIMNKYVN